MIRIEIECHPMISRFRRLSNIIQLLARLRLLPVPDSPPAVVDFALGKEAIKCLQHRTELLELSRIVADLKPKAILEIGTYKGGTLFTFARLAAPDATIISLDQWPVTRLHPTIFRWFCRNEQRVHTIYGDSKSLDTLARVRALLPMLDFLFIDGDHGYDGVRSDFEMYAPLVRKGGIIAFHDIASVRLAGCDVPKLWAEIKPLYRHTEIIEDATREWGGIGVLYSA